MLRDVSHHKHTSRILIIDLAMDVRENTVISCNDRGDKETRAAAADVKRSSLFWLRV